MSFLNNHFSKAIVHRSVEKCFGVSKHIKFNNNVSSAPALPTFLRWILRLKSEFWSLMHALFFQGFELRTELSNLNFFGTAGPVLEKTFLHFLLKMFCCNFYYRRERITKTCSAPFLILNKLLIHHDAKVYIWYKDFWK